MTSKDLSVGDEIVVLDLGRPQVKAVQSFTGHIPATGMFTHVIASGSKIRIDRIRPADWHGGNGVRLARESEKAVVSK